VAVVIPEFVPQHWRHAFMHNQSALLLEFALRSRPNAVLISIRFLLSQAAQEARLQREAELVRQAEEAKTQAAAETDAAPEGEEPPPVEK
jgi:hypothetical protein